MALPSSIARSLPPYHVAAHRPVLFGTGAPYPCNLLHRRQCQPGDQAGVVVVELEAAAMEMRHRGGERQAEARARQRAAFIESGEALLDALAVTHWNARSMIGDLDARLAVARPDRQRHIGTP